MERIIPEMDAVHTPTGTVSTSKIEGTFGEGQQPEPALKYWGAPNTRLLAKLNM